MRKHSIGPGDETFMCGRFIESDGKQKNQPSVRFGNVSMMPHEIKHARGHLQESFLVETRSLSGYSGSPVFVYLEHATFRPGENNMDLIRKESGPWLLGIDYGHMPIFEKVKEKDKETNKLTDTPQGYVVKSNSGQMAVIPAWKLRELLYSPEAVEEREKADLS